MATEIITNIRDIQEKYELASKIPLFATQEYADYLLKTKNIKTIWFIEKVDNSITFIIPFAIKRKLIFKIGLFLTAVNNLCENSLIVESKILDEFVAIIKKKKLCDWIQQPPNWAIFKNYPRKSVYAPFGTYRIDLQSKTTDELFNLIYAKDRSDIRKALNDGIEVKSGFELLPDAIKLIIYTAKKANISFPSTSELNNLKDNIKIFTSYHQHIPQSSAIFFVSKYSWYNMYAGTKEKPYRGSNSLLYWSAIKSAKEDGALYFDFVGARIDPEPGSKQDKIQIFKRHFGGDLYKGYLWKMPIKKYKYFLYNLLFKISYLVKGKKNKGDIIDQEIRRFNIKKVANTIER